MPTVVRFYSLKSQSFMHFLKFRLVVYSIRCSPRVVAISHAACTPLNGHHTVTHATRTPSWSPHNNPCSPHLLHGHHIATHVARSPLMATTQLSMQPTCSSRPSHNPYAAHMQLTTITQPICYHKATSRPPHNPSNPPLSLLSLLILPFMSP